MATTSLWRVKGPIGKVLNYAGNEEKTAENKSSDSLDDVISYAGRDEATDVKRFVSGINCQPETAKSEMEAVKKQYGKTGGTVAYHGYQSFAQGEVTPELAHEIGKALAQELWGDRYQVLVATHLDKESHIHNHFVINTVSFADGGKFHRTNDDYRKMQEVSDRLCREHGLSVVAEPEGKSRHYSEWHAEKEGEPTFRKMIRADIDDAVSQSMTGIQFMNMMKAKGYEFQLYTKDGLLRERPALRPPGAEKFFRFYKLGEGYSLDDISRRILENSRPKLPFDELTHKSVKRSYKLARKSAKRKLHGLYALYIRYCYELRIIVKHPRNKPMHKELRADAIKLAKLDEQTKFLGRYGLTSVDEVAEHKAAAESLIASLSAERYALNGNLRSARKKGDEGQVKEISCRIKEHTEQLRVLRREVRLCDEITGRSNEIRQRLEAAEEYRKGKTENEYCRGCSGTGRENEPGSDRGRG